MGLKKLFIDLEKFEAHENCGQGCSYYYHPGNDGMLSLQEMATYAVVCRKCEKENCVTSCPFEALEKNEDKILKRANMRCTSCKTCSHACHSGVILPEFIPYMAFNCDFCINQLKVTSVPECARACKCGAVQYGDFKEDEAKDMYAVGENIIIHSIHWQRNNVKKR